AALAARLAEQFREGRAEAEVKAGASGSSPSDNITVARRADAAHQRVRLRMDHDRLDRPHAAVVADVEPVSERAETFPRLSAQRGGCDESAVNSLRVARFAETRADHRGHFERLLHPHPDLND